MTKPTQAAIEAARERLAKAVEADNAPAAFASRYLAGDYDTHYSTQALAIALQEMSDVVKYGVEALLSEGYSVKQDEVAALRAFILPDPVADPLVECLLELDFSSDALVAGHDAKWLVKALAARGLQIVPVQP